MNSHLLTRVIVTMLLATVVAVATAQEVGTSAPLRVLTYNVRYASDQPPNRWADRRPVAKAMLDELNVDLIGMQEAKLQQVKDFETDLPDYKWIGTGRDGGDKGEFMAVFYRESRLKPVKHGHYWLSETPDEVASSSWGSACNRMVTWVRFEDLSSHGEFYLINTHLDHKSREAREKGAELIVKRSAKLDVELPVVITGDFNSADTSSAVYKTFLDGGFVDTWNSAKTKGTEMNTFHGYRPPSKPTHKRIDWILTKGKVSTVSTRIVEFQKNRQYPSDHFPVSAELIISSDHVNVSKLSFGEEVQLLVSRATGDADKVTNLVREFVLNGDESHFISLSQNVIVGLGSEAHPAILDILNDEKIGDKLFQPNAGVIVKESPLQRISRILLRGDTVPPKEIVDSLWRFHEHESVDIRKAATKVVASTGDPKWIPTIQSLLRSSETEEAQYVLDGIGIAARGKRLDIEASRQLFETVENIWPANEELKIAETLFAIDPAAAVSRLLQDDVFDSEFRGFYGILSAFRKSGVLIPREKLHQIIPELDKPRFGSLRQALLCLAAHKDLSLIHI